MGLNAPARLVFLASGRGSCFEALCRAIQSGEIPNAQAVALICNRSQAPVIKIAERAHVPVHLIDHDRFRNTDGKRDRAAFETKLEKTLTALQPDWILLAGYMRILGSGIVRRWAGRIVNIHPSLLPEFRGLHAQRQALENGAKVTGCTVHLVTEGLDDGPIVEQSRVAIEPGDTVESLSARLLPVEHATYLRAMKKLLTQ